MAFFTVDQDKCKKDGICAAECPGSLIKMKGEKGFPSLIEGTENLCINCGHCVAVCPYGAISLSTMRSEECIPIQEELLPSSNQAKHFLMSRRSIRSYKNQAVDRAILSQLIDIAQYAPSAKNLRPVHWLVIESKEEVRRLSKLVVDFMRDFLNNNPNSNQSISFKAVIKGWERGKDRVCRDAPHVVVAHASENLASAQNDCTIALTYLELAAFSMGLGPCWAGYFSAAAANFPPMIQALNLPEGHKVFGAMLIGYPRYPYYRIPLRNHPPIIWR